MGFETLTAEGNASQNEAVAAMERAIDFATEEVKRIGVKTRCVENVYTRAFEKSAQKLVVDPLIARSSVLREKASKRFEATKEALFTEAKGYLPTLKRYLDEVDGHFDTLNAMTASLLVSNDAYERVSKKLAELRHLCHEAIASIERSEQSIEKHTL